MRCRARPVFRAVDRPVLGLRATRFLRACSAHGTQMHEAFRWVHRSHGLDRPWEGHSGSGAALRGCASLGIIQRQQVGASLRFSCRARSGAEPCRGGRPHAGRFRCCCGVPAGCCDEDRDRPPLAAARSDRLARRQSARAGRLAARFVRADRQVRPHGAGFDRAQGRLRSRCRTPARRCGPSARSCRSMACLSA